MINRTKTKNFHIRQRPARKKPLLRIKIYGGLFFCLLAGLIYFLVFSPVLWTEKIEVYGLSEKDGASESIGRQDIEDITEKILTEKFLGLIPLRSVILIPVDKIKADISASWPEIASVEIKRNLIFWPSRPKVLKVEVKIREPVGVWCSGPAGSPKQCFYIDKEGVIYKESPAMDGSLILTINDLRAREIRAKEPVVSKELMDFILETGKELPAVSDLRAANFIINSEEDLRVSTSEGFGIYFNPEEPTASQMDILKRVLEEEIKEGRSSLEYVDLRVKGRAYYKVKNE